MKLLNLLLLATVLTVLFGCNDQLKKKTVRYTDYEWGDYYNYYKKYDSAFLMFSRYVNAPDDTLKKGKAYSYMGDIQWKKGDLYGARQSLIIAARTLDTLNEEHHEELAEIYNLLGNVDLDLKLYDDAISNYNLAMSFTKKSDNRLEYMNGKGIAFKNKKNYTDAIALYDTILNRKAINEQIIPRAMDNRAVAKWLQNPAYPALPELQAVLNIRINIRDSAGLNASYAHLSDYYSKSNPDSAFIYAQKMLEMAKKNQSPDDMRDALNKLIRLTRSATTMGQLYNQFKTLSDSIQFSRDTTSNRFALVKYDFQKNQADNLQLQQHVTRQQIWIYTVAAVGVAMIILLSVWYDKRRKRIKQESENAIRESKLKTSQKVHDVVANGLYVILNKLEHSKEIERERLATGIEELYEKSRNISYEDEPLRGYADYDKKINDLLDSFSNSRTKVFTAGSRKELWSRVSEPHKNEIYLTLKEIMINMSKHSQAQNAAVAFRQENNKGIINYTDDGIGFPEGVKLGNGLNSTVNRIKSLSGEVIFGKSERGGASVAISFPLQSSKS